MFFSVILILQAVLLWALVTFLAHEDPQASLTITLKIFLCLFVAKLLMVFLGTGAQGIAFVAVQIALIYLLIWKLADPTHKVTAQITGWFLLATIVLQL